MNMENEEKVIWGVFLLILALLGGLMWYAITAPDDGKQYQVCTVVGGVAICGDN